MININVVKNEHEWPAANGFMQDFSPYNLDPVPPPVPVLNVRFD
jgi:hypothetical protein